MKRLISKCMLAVLCFSLVLSGTPVYATENTDSIIKNAKVEFINQNVSELDAIKSNNLITESSSLVWGTDGGVEYRRSDNTYRVWGWSTCEDAIGTDVYHYTRARFEQAGLGTIFGDSGRVWGKGKVYAYGGYCVQDIRDSSYARVYYGV